MPDPSWLVKRAVAVPGDTVPEQVRPAVRAAPGATVPPGSLVVGGDAERSQDSRHFGYVRARDVVGVVLRRL
ncbi:S26 family signal peptidase [Actinomadura kijaniata]|uniref:S26 family signal peptidase n=1 Tax=Actinomadura kijaniata TaxID=46161 RepID=UPI003F1946D7